MILILTNQAVFVSLSVVTIPPFVAAIFILTLNHADVIGDQSAAVTQNAWFCYMLCAAISGEISILIQTRAESWGRFPVPRICHWESKETSDGYLLTAMVSILLSLFKILQLTNVHNYKLQAVYFSFL